jgi:hypothetical protein
VRVEDEIKPMVRLDTVQDIVRLEVAQENQRDIIAEDIRADLIQPIGPIMAEEVKEIVNVFASNSEIVKVNHVRNQEIEDPHLIHYKVRMLEEQISIKDA